MCVSHGRVDGTGAGPGLEGWETPWDVIVVIIKLTLVGYSLSIKQCLSASLTNPVGQVWLRPHFTETEVQRGKNICLRLCRYEVAQSDESPSVWIPRLVWLVRTQGLLGTG